MGGITSMHPTIIYRYMKGGLFKSNYPDPLVETQQM